MKSRGLIYKGFGVPRQVLEVFEACRGHLKTGEVEIGIELVPINPSDLVSISGAYPNHTKLPKVAGYEGMGRITRVAGQSNFFVGDRVIAINSSGTWQTHLVLAESRVIKVQDDISDELAARAYINPLSALLMLASTDVAGKTVILTAGGSNCARLLGQWALVSGAKTVMAVTTSAAHDPSLSDLGIVPLRPEQVLSMSFGRSVCFDAVGGELAVRLMGSLPVGSNFTSYGLLSGAPITRVPKGIEFNQFHLRNWLRTAGSQEVGRRFEEVFKRLQRSKLPPTVEYSWTDWPKALEHFSMRGRKRKPLLRFSAGKDSIA